MNVDSRAVNILTLRTLGSDPRAALVSPSAFDDAPGAVRAALLPGLARTWVDRHDSSISGFVQARPRRFVLGWEIIRLCVQPELASSISVQAVTARLSQAVLEHLQARGIPRLFARAGLESQGRDALADCGFAHFMSESVFVRDPSPTWPPDEMPVGARYRMPQDAWPLHQLESRQTPPLIRQLEGLTSLSWAEDLHRRHARAGLSELVVERDGEIVGWLGWSRAPCPDYMRVGLLIQNDEAPMAEALIQYALHAISSTSPRLRVAVRLRDYQIGLRQILLDHGFIEYGREALLIKHGRLQAAPRKVPRLLDLAPTIRALSPSTGPK